MKRYRGWAKEQCLLEEPLPPLGDLLALLEQTMPAHCPPQNTSSVEPYRDLVAQLVKENVEIAAIRCRLEERGYTGSYSAVRRFARKIKPRTPEATVRVERKPGEEAQVDFGYAGRMIDPVTEALRRTWAFVMTLSWSRHPLSPEIPPSVASPSSYSFIHSHSIGSAHTMGRSGHHLPQKNTLPFLAAMLRCGSLPVSK